MSSVVPPLDPNPRDAQWLERLKAISPSTPPALPEAARRAVEDAAIRAWRQGATSAVRPWAWWLGGAAATALVAAFVVWFGLAASTSVPEPLPVSTAYMPPFRPFHVDNRFAAARETSTGLATSLHLIKARELNDNRPDQPRQILAGRVWETSAKGFATALLDGRVRLTLWPKSRLRFLEADGQVVTQLEAGRVLVDVRLSNLKPTFELRVPGARLVDLGTRYDVWMEAGRVNVRVDEGSVRIDRLVGGQAEVRGGRAVAWQPGNASMEVRLAPEAARLYAEGQALTREAPLLHLAAPAAEAKAAYESAPETAATPAAPAPATSWERTLASLGDLKRASLVKYFAATEQQMKQGYSRRAAQDLERFIASHPAAEAEKAYWYLVLAYKNLGETDNLSRACQAYLGHFPQGTWAAEAGNACRN